MGEAYKFKGFQVLPEDAPLLRKLSQDQLALLSAGTPTEISEKFNIPIGTAKSRQHRARAALQALRDQQ